MEDITKNKIKLELKNTVTKVNTKFNSRMKRIKERISELEDRKIEITKSEKQKTDWKKVLKAQRLE